MRILLMQLPVPNNPATNVPLAAGYLKAYAQARGLLDRVSIDILPRVITDEGGDALLVDAIVARRPDLLGISLYTWNSERSLEIALRARQALPQLTVVVGGPEVQRDNDWVLAHPAVDFAVIGEGEQTFADLLESLLASRQPAAQLAVPGLALRDAGGQVAYTPERAALSDLSAVPSPYLLGYLEPGPMLMVEVSRWCPYSCSFCLYGRNMGTKLGSRYFGLERVLAEIRWGLERGAAQVHFIEANLNLVPLFRPLMAALADLNADGRLALYAELRGEHLTEEAVALLARAGLRVAEVGLQTANPAALAAALRRTDLAKWAAGTRRLYSHGVEVLLDVILGLPEDDAAGVAATLDFIAAERLGPYDVFTLQVLPGTAVRREAARYGLVFQDRPPYYVLGTDRLPYAELRRLRRQLKLGADHDPDAVDGCPPPRLEHRRPTTDHCPSGGQIVIQPSSPVMSGTPPEPGHRRQLAPQPAPSPDSWLLASESCRYLSLVDADAEGWAAAQAQVRRLAAHVDVVARWEDAGPDGRLTSLVVRALADNPSALIDLYLLADDPPPPGELAAWRAGLPFQPGYLDRVAVYRRPAPEPPFERVSPRLWLVLPWTAQAEPGRYEGVARLIWRYQLAHGEEPPLGAWRSAGGAGVLVCGAPPERVAALRRQTDVPLWDGLW